MKIAFTHGPVFTPFVVELVSKTLVGKDAHGRVAFAMAADSHNLHLVELADATLAERLALHYAGFDALKGLNVQVAESATPPPDPAGPEGGARD